MHFTRPVTASVLMAIASTSFACPLPPLVAIPAKDQIAAVEPDVRAATAQYFENMKAFTACVQAELTAAGGDAAPRPIRGVLIRRHNAAVTEAETVLKLFTATVGAGQPAPAAPLPN